MKERHTLHHDSAAKRYEFEIEGRKAYVEYTEKTGVMTLEHTYVPQQLEGRGIGSELVKAVLEDIKQNKKQVIPQCDFIAQYIFRHPEWEELIVKEVTAK